MGSGPFHYKEAERLLNELSGLRSTLIDLVRKTRNATESATLAEMPQQVIAQAQVHATLALAAASAQNIRRNGAVESQSDGWAEVLS